MGYTSHYGGTHPIICFASDEPLDFEWGYSDNTLYPPFGVTEWKDKSSYPVPREGYDKYFGWGTATTTYESTTWNILAVDCSYWDGGDGISASDGLSAYSWGKWDNKPDISSVGYDLLDNAKAVPYTTTTTEIGTEDYVFKYSSSDKTYASIDTDGNAVFKELTTDAGSLTSQMAAKQNLMTPGANIQINGNTISATDTTYEEFDGDNAGLVPAVQTQSGKFLKDDGTWATPSGGGGSANIVELTQAEYDALPTSKLSDDTLYMVYFDGGQSLDPNYNYYKYGENDEIVVRVYHEGQADQEVLWFFNNWTATALDNSIPAELQAWKPTNTQPIFSDSYAEVGGAQTSWVGFYANSIRSWNITLATSYIGVVNAVVNPFPTSEGQQTNGYYSPYVYIQDSPPFTKIYYNNHEFTHKVTANPSEAATETLQKLKVDGIVYGVSGGGGEASVVELTQAQYNALTPAEKTNGSIYMTHDGGYDFISYDNGKIIVRVNNSTNETLWFFNGFSKESDDVAIPDELVPYLPTQTSPQNIMQAKAWTDNTSTTQNGWIGFVFPGTTSVKIRSWSNNGRQLITGTFWGVLDINGSTAEFGQTEPYSAPTEGLTLLPNRIYYNDTLYADNATGGSSGGGYSSTLLFQGSYSSVGELELSDDITNYDEIEIWVNGVGSAACCPYRFNVANFMANYPYVAGATYNNRHFLPSVFASYYMRIIMGTANNKLYVWDIQSQVIKEVYGIKY